MSQPRKTPNGGGRGKGRARSARPHRLRRSLAPVLSAAGFFAFAGALYVALIAGRPPLDVELGQPAPREYRARAAFRRTDIAQTRADREAAYRAEPLVFRHVPDQWEAAAAQFIEAVQGGSSSLLWQGLPQGIDPAAFAGLAEELRSREGEVRRALGALGEATTISREDAARPLVAANLSPTATLLAPPEGPRTVPVAELVVLDPESVGFAEAFEPAFGALGAGQAGLLARGTAALLRPSAELDLELSMENAQRAADAVPPVVESMDKDRLILAKGSEVTRQHLEDLAREREQYWAGPEGQMLRLQRLGGLAIVLLIALGAGALYARRYRPELLMRGSQVLAFAFLTLGVAVFARLCVVWGVTPLCVPVPIAVMVMSLVYDQRFGLGAAVFYAFLVRLAGGGEDSVFIVLLMGGVVTALVTGQVRTRSALVKAGLWTGAAQFCTVWGLGLASVLEGGAVPLRFWQSALMVQSIAAAVNGIACGFVVSGILPAIEVIFGITTDIRLIEWSDPNQPLLQRLLLDAPGSYHHSMVVGSLAAEAAEAIGANPLLARVSAYFHDVGKLKKPEYYAENIGKDEPNPHDDLSPTMSSLIITAHPKDGAEMAEQYGVPRVVSDVILQSHGSSVLRYFLNKARQEDNGDRGEIEERHFRYRLPKPQGKEAAIVMLCDAVESAARSMGSLSVAQLRNLVRDIVMDRLHDGQLDESRLTVTDLKRLEDCLVRGLTAVFHSRVTYPGQQERVNGRAKDGPRAEDEGAAAARDGDAQSAGQEEPGEAVAQTTAAPAPDEADDGTGNQQ